MALIATLAVACGVDQAPAEPGSVPVAQGTPDVQATIEAAVAATVTARLASGGVQPVPTPIPTPSATPVPPGGVRPTPTPEGVPPPTPTPGSGPPTPTPVPSFFGSGQGTSGTTLVRLPGVAEPFPCTTSAEAMGAFQQLIPIMSARRTEGTFPGSANEILARADLGTQIQQGDLEAACESLDEISAILSVLPNTSVNLTRLPLLDYVDRLPPVASLISFGDPDADGVIEVIGSPGSVPANSEVMVSTVQFGGAALVTSDAEGRFTASIVSAPGATVQVRHNPYAPLPLTGDPQIQNHWPGTLIRVPEDSRVGPGTRFSSAGYTDLQEGGVIWNVDGNVEGRAVGQGDLVLVTGTVTFLLPGGVTGPPPFQFVVNFGIEPLFDADGAQVSGGYSFVSRILTPTGLPIESAHGLGLRSLGQLELDLLGLGGSLHSPFSLRVPIPEDLPDGTYGLYMWIDDPRLGTLAQVDMTRLSQPPGFDRTTLGVVTVGSPGAPRLSPMLLVESPNQATRGVISDEEKGKLAFSGRVASVGEFFVVQPRTPGDGQLISYRLEPYFPLLSMGDRGLPGAPVLPLALPGGTLTVSVQTPSGATQELGTAQIRQIRTGGRATSAGLPLSPDGGVPTNVLQLTTLSDEFAYGFEEYGQYSVTMFGSVRDIWGEEYPFGGTFEVWAAETLDVETAALPATPFREGDRLPTVVNVYPGVPADINMSFQLFPVDGSFTLSDSVTGTANRFGYFDGRGKLFRFDRAGEYVVQVRARYVDRFGTLWLGTRRWGSAVGSLSPDLIAHGRLGHDPESEAERDAWFITDPLRVAAVSSEISFPYYSGDVVWVGGGDSISMPITVEDTRGLVALLAGQRSEDRSLFEERLAAGEQPLSNSTAGGLEPVLAPGDIDQWGYAYRAIQRPGVRVREMVGTDETYSASYQSTQTHLAQRGMGVAGDLPNDIRWQFGAAIFKRPEQGVGEVAIYASLSVGVRGDDPVGSRVHPPFQGAAGGPTSGPMMTVKGREVNLFLMPTGVRPGGVLEVGDRFVFAGQIGPPLASQVSVLITSPSGQVRTITGQANPIGYFFDPDSEFIVDEPGLWGVDVSVLHDGLTSAGPVRLRTPIGDILGTRDGEFHVYVVPADSRLLNLRLPELSFAASPGTNPLRLFFPFIGEGWTNIEGLYTISTPGFILDQGALTKRTGWLEGVFDPARLARSFPNLDLTARHELTRGLSDQVFFSALLTGLDPNGERGYAANLLTMVGEDIYDLN